MWWNRHGKTHGVRLLNSNGMNVTLEEGMLVFAYGGVWIDMNEWATAVRLVLC